VTRREACLADMSNGVAWEDLIKRYSKSTIYECFDEYQKVAENNYRGLTEKKRSLLEEIDDLQTSTDEKTNCIHDLEENETVLLDKVAGLERIKNELSSSVTELETKIESLETGVEELKSRGITPENLKVIFESDINSLDELLKRVKTVEDYSSIKNEFDELDHRLEMLKGEIKSDDQYLIELRREIDSEKNKLSLLNSEYLLYNNCIDILVELLRKGWTGEIITGISRALLNFGINGDPISSAKFFLKKLDKTKEDIELERVIFTKKTELNVLTKKLDDTRAILKTIENDIIKNIDNLKNESISSIEQVSRNTKEQHINILKEIEKSSIKFILDTSEIANKQITQLSKKAQNSTIELNNIHISNIKYYEDQIKKLGDMREKIGIYKTLIDKTTLILGILNTPEDVLKLDLGNIVRIIDRINLYITLRFPDVKVIALKNVSEKEFGISGIYEVYLSSISKWLSYAIKDVSRGIGYDVYKY